MSAAPAGRGSARLLPLVRFGAPVLFMIVLVAAWQAGVEAWHVPPYILPAPSLIGATLVKDWPLLSGALLVTLGTTLKGLLLALAGGVGLAILFARSRILEWVLYPYAVILQVTPVIAIAPLLLIYTSQEAAVLICAWIVAFFPILSNTTLGLRATDHNLLSLFRLYGATGWQTLWLLRMKSALPYFLSGLRIGGGLSLIGAVVAEIAAGSAGKGAGLAYRIVESQYRLNTPRMFAALLLLAASGVLIFLLLSALSHLLLRNWHESALDAGR